LDSSVLIVLVEDELAIQEFLLAALEDAGYAVASAQSGEDAIAILEDRIGECRALITDIRLLPGKLKMTGWDVAHRARELNPGLAIIYMTGDSGVDWSSKGVPKSVLVTKPFAPAQIISAVSQLLNASG
jgi:CheY-like chemotaxis protein